MSEVKTNKISSLASNNDITIDPDGTGDTIIASGNVGIGTASPDSLVHLSGSNPKLHIRNSSDSNRGGYLQDNGTTFVLGSNSGVRNLVFSPDNTERMRLDTSGKLCVGTTAAVSLAMLTLQPADTNRIINTRSFNTSAQYHHVFENNSGTLVGGIVVSTTATAYNTSSDYRLKTAVTYDWDATTRLKQLKPARFEWITDGDDAIPVDGFLAHEAQAVVPEAVTGTKDEVDDDGNPVYQGIDQAKLVPLLVKTIQELEARITALEAE